MIRRENDLVWWLMITFCSVIVLGGGAWATNMNEKVNINIEKVAKMETSISYMQGDIREIKDLFKGYLERLYK